MKGKALPVLALLFVASVIAWPAAAQNSALLPQSFAGWIASGNSTQVAAAQLQQLPPAQADAPGDATTILREYGITSAERREYAKGPQTAAITLYDMTDPSAAFGAFTFLRDPGAPPLPAGATASFSAVTRHQAWLVIGNFVVDISGAQARPADADLRQLATGLKPHADRRPYPVIAGFLPQEGVMPGDQRYPIGQGSAVSLPAHLHFIPGTEKYVLGPQALADVFPVSVLNQPDWLGFGRSAEAVVARYQLGGADKGKEATLLLALYPTQQIAAAQYDTISKALNVNPDSADAAAGASHPAVYGTRSSSLVGLVTGVDSRDTAQGILNQIHYATDVTWNEPSATYTEPSFPTMIIGVFVNTGILMVLAIAVGIGFGGFRLLVKLILPGKVFDTQSRVEILQLGLTAKPIDAEDFYKLSPLK